MSRTTAAASSRGASRVPAARLSDERRVQVTRDVLHHDYRSVRELARRYVDHPDPDVRANARAILIGAR